MRALRPDTPIDTPNVAWWLSSEFGVARSKSSARIQTTKAIVALEFGVAC
jgi:hypothetical protein